MSTPLEIRTEQTLFLIKEKCTQKPLKLPKNWTTHNFSNLGELEEWVHQGDTQNKRILIILKSQDFKKYLQGLKQKFPTDVLVKLGFIVLTEDADEFLTKNSSISELLDVIPEKNLVQSLKFQLVRAVRQLIRKEERENRKIGQKTLERLNQIFITLSAERDAQRLLATILAEAIELTSAQAGTLYVVEEKDGEFFFNLRIRNNGSNEMYLQHTNSKVIESSTVGYVVSKGEKYNTANIANISPMMIPQFDPSFDHVLQGKSKSALTVPLKNSRNEIIAVLQLINKVDESGERQEEAVAFDAEDESIMASFSTQAAICLENTELYDDIQKLFNGFVKASITAIEARDPSTGGHSERVAKMCVALAEATSETDRGIYRSVRFKMEEIRELEYAALLHDFGKIGVREEVLVKAKKLYPFQLQAIKERVSICRAALSIQYQEKKINTPSKLKEIEKWYQTTLSRLENEWKLILAANEPSVLKKENAAALADLMETKWMLPDGTQYPLINEEEFNALQVTKGSLTNNERLEVESHVRHTYQFLKMIPWTKNFRNLPEIAYAHHEKLNGSGYPRGLVSHEIPIQSKIMTISDIYDALTAADRWYKEAVPIERALDILNYEVAEGQLDPILFEIFVEKKIFELTQPKKISRTG